MIRFRIVGALMCLLGTAVASGQQTGDRLELGKLGSGATVTFVRAGTEWGIEISGGDAPAIAQPKPAQIQLYRPQGVTDLAAGYQSVQPGAKDENQTHTLVIGKSRIADSPASFDVEDRWTISGATLSLSRKIDVTGAQESAGFYSAIRLATAPAIKWEDVNCLVPGLLYDDPAHAGGGSPAGVAAYRTKRFTIREDLLSAPMVAMSMRDGNWAAVMDLAPRGDTIMADSTPGVLIDERIMIGALGAREIPGAGMELAFWMPCTTAEIPGGRGGRGGVATTPATTAPAGFRGRYHPVKAGFSHSYQVGFRLGRGESILDVQRNAWRWAWDSLKPAAKVPPIDLQVARTALLDHLSDRVMTVADRSGIPFEADTRTGRLSQYGPKIIMGFCGKNLEGADQLLQEGDLDKTPRGQKMRQQGLAIIDSLIRLVPMSPPAGVGFHINTGEAVPANFVPGFTTRMPAEDLAVLVNTYRREKAAGRDHPEWIRWVTAYCDWLLTQQGADGSFPAAWQGGTGQVIRDGKTTTYVLVPVLVRLGQVTGDRKYVDAATRAAEFVWTHYGSKGVYMGATGTGNNIADKEAGMLSLEAFLDLYDSTKDPKWLQRAVAAANYTETWIWIWNVPMAMDADDATLHWKKGVPTIGVNGIGSDVIGGVDQYLDWSVPTYARLYKLTGDEHYLDVAYVLLHGTKAMLALPGRTYDLMGPGWQQEHWNMGPNRKGMGGHRNWLVWVSTNHLNGIMGLEALDPGLFKQLSRPR